MHSKRNELFRCVRKELQNGFFAGLPNANLVLANMDKLRDPNDGSMTIYLTGTNTRANRGFDINKANQGSIDTLFSGVSSVEIEGNVGDRGVLTLHSEAQLVKALVASPSFHYVVKA